jgi:hypothetical protein
VLKFLADLVILAKHTAQIASGEKNGPRPVGPGDGRFFAKVQAGMGYPDTGTDPAKAGLALQPVHPTPARATFTIGQLVGEWSIHIRPSCINQFSPLACGIFDSAS